MTANCLLVLATLTAAVAAVTPISLQQLQPFTDGEPTPEASCISQNPALQERIKLLLSTVSGTNADSARWRRSRGDRFVYVHYNRTSGAMSGCACGSAAPHPTAYSDEPLLAAHAGRKLALMYRRLFASRENADSLLPPGTVREATDWIFDAGDRPFESSHMDGVRQADGLQPYDAHCRTLPFVLCGGVHDDDHAIAAPSQFFDYGGWAMHGEPPIGLAHMRDRRVPWEERIEKLVWRGATHEGEPPSRRALVAANGTDPDAIDAADPEVTPASRMGPTDLARYKYTGYTNGVLNAIAYRLDLQLALGQLIFWASNERVPPQEQTWYSSYLQPNEHFLLADDNFNNIGALVRAARLDDANMRRIAENAAAFADVEFSDTCLRSYTATVVRAMHEHVYDRGGKEVERWQCPDEPAECTAFEIRAPDA